MAHAHGLTAKPPAGGATKSTYMLLEPLLQPRLLAIPTKQCGACTAALVRSHFLFTKLGLPQS
eukprot:6454735-Amphidinium_carterae.1